MTKFRLTVEIFAAVAFNRDIKKRLKEKIDGVFWWKEKWKFKFSYKDKTKIVWKLKEEKWKIIVKKIQSIMNNIFQQNANAMKS